MQKPNRIDRSHRDWYIESRLEFAHHRHTVHRNAPSDRILITAGAASCDRYDDSDGRTT